MKKKLFIVAIIMIIIAAFVVAAIGFNVDIKYRKHTSIIVPLGEQFNEGDVKNIATEVFGKSDVVIEKSGLYDDEVSIRVADASDEQINNLKNKLNEKYNVVQKVYVPISNDYNVEDVQAAVKEALGKEDVKVEKEADNENYAAIELNLLTEKDLENVNNKINEKFNLQNDINSISSTNVITFVKVPRVRLIDMAKQYILFTAIGTLAVLVYFVIRYRKLGIKDVLQDAITVLVFSELLYMSIIAIVRFPINKLIVMGAYAVYFAILVYLNSRYMIKSESKK